MKKVLIVLTGLLLAAPLFAAPETNAPGAPIFAAFPTNAGGTMGDVGGAPAADETEANYTKAIEGRTDDILKALALTDAKKAAAVHDDVMTQYRALRTWHDENDAKLKAAKDTNAVAQINASLKTLHNHFIGELAKQLTPEQVDIVKDKMTYNVVHVTFGAYLKMYPDLTEAEQKQIMAWLVEARETSMDQGSSNEKHAVFGKYKGRINNYLSKQGYDAKTGKKKTDQPSGGSSTNQPAK